MGTPPTQPWYHRFGVMAVDCALGQSSERKRDRGDRHLRYLWDLACFKPFLDQRLGACGGGIEGFVSEWRRAW